MKTKLSIILTVLFSFNCLAQVGQTFLSNGINYKITSDSAVEVFENKNINGIVVLPETVSYKSNNYKVAAIGTKAFFLCTGLTSLTIPNSVNTIGEEAFRECQSLKEINIPSSVTSIDKLAFVNCIGLISCTIPNTIKTISESLFNGCTSLTSLTIPNTVTSIGYSAFFYCRSLKSLIIPTSVVTIGNEAFFDCSSLEKIDIPNSIKIIGEYTFRGCTSLVSVSIPESITSIGYGAFYDCSKLASISIPNSVTSIGIFAFNKCTSLQSVNIGNSVTSIGAAAFQSCTSLRSVTVNWLSPFSISSDVFSGLILSRISLNVPLGAENAYKNALVWKDFGLSSFTYDGLNYFITAANTVKVGINLSAKGDIVIPETVTYNNEYYVVTNIGDYAFLDCTSLTFVTIPNSITNIGVGAFSKCTSLKSVNIGNSVTNIDVGAFQSCSSLSSISIPNSVTSIDAGAFQFCTSLTSINIPNAVTYIGLNAFDGCSSLTSVNIPNSLSRIDKGSFQSCTSLRSVTVNWSNPLSIGSDVFSGLTLSNITLYVPLGTEIAYKNALVWKDFGLSSFTYGGLNYFITAANTVEVGINLSAKGDIVIPETVTNNSFDYQVTSIGSNAFNGCTNLTSISIPTSVTSIGITAFRGCRGLTSITIPNSITSIGSAAFDRCAGLLAVTVNWSTPLPIVSRVFSGLTLSNIRLYVPLGTEIAYNSTAVWKDFSISFVKDGIIYRTTSATTVSVDKNPASSGSVVIPISVNFNNVIYEVNRIDASAFKDCTGLTAISFPYTVTSIGNSAFEGCTDLTAITIPHTVINIGNNAFGGCTGLKFVTLNSITPIIINASVFDGLTLSNIRLYIPFGYEKAYENALVWKDFKLSVFSYDWLNCRIISDTTVEVVANSAIRLKTDMIIPESVPFNTINYQVTSLGSQAFSGFSGLTSITIPDSVNSFGTSAFSGCTGLTSITIPSLVTSIGQSAFERCTGLTSVVIPNSVISIGNSAFERCTGLTSIIIPNLVTSISNYTFNGCSSLISITIHNSVTSIGLGAFNSCTNLRSINIPNSVTSIGSIAFANCNSLIELTANWTNPISIDSKVFAGNTLSTISLNVPTRTAIAYKAAEVWKDFYPIAEPVDGNVQVGQTFTLNGINYYVRKATFPFEVAVDKNKDFVGVAEIPDTVSYSGNSFAVTLISSYAFLNCTGLTSVSIPNSVKSIGVEAFSNCSGLTVANIGNSVAVLSNKLFWYCTSLTSITIPSSVTNIGNQTFGGCQSLNSIIIPNSVTNIGNNVFGGCTSLTSINIPNSVTSIGGYAFSDCKGLNVITVNWTSPLTINSSIFQDVNISTISLNVPAGTETAYKAAAVWKDFYLISEPVDGTVQVGQTFIVNGINYFVRKATLPYEVGVGKNTNFVGVADIPDMVSHNGNSFAVNLISSYAFQNCTGLTSVTIPNSVKSIGVAAFSSSIGLASVSIGNSIVDISANLFEGCTSLTSVIIPNSITSIGTSSFSGCKGLTAITIPNSVKLINNTAFSDCTSLKSISIPNSVTGIGMRAFYNCTGLKSVSIPNSIVSISPDMFLGCTSLNSVSIPDSVTTIGSKAFSGCTSLNSISLPLVRFIGSSAFENCSSLTSVNMSNSANTISEYAFSNCTSLKTVTIPISVFRIGSLAFYNCTSLTSVTVNWPTPLSIIGGTFGSTTFLSNLTLYVPVGTATAYKAALVWKDFGTITEFVAPLVGQKIVVDGINYIVTKATLPYEVAVDTNNNANSGRFTTAAQIGITGAVIIPENVDNIGNSFSVTSISANAFQNSRGITSIIIPSSVKSIGDYAFSNCSGLTAVTVNGIIPPAINRTVFENLIIANITLNVPNIALEDFSNASVWKDFGTNTLSTDSFSIKSQIKFYPNPTNDIVHISLQNETINQINVYNLLGGLLKSQKGSSDKETVSLQELPNATYLVEIISDKAKQSVKVIKK